MSSTCNLLPPVCDRDAEHYVYASDPSVDDYDVNDHRFETCDSHKDSFREILEDLGYDVRFESIED